MIPIIQLLIDRNEYCNIKQMKLSAGIIMFCFKWVSELY